MIAWTIEAATASGCFDRILVSTDDDEIAEVSRAWGAEAPFVRPLGLSDDWTGTLPVISHAVGWQASHGEPATEVCCLYAAAPTMQVGDIRHGLDLLGRTGCSYVFPVTSYATPIQRAMRISSSGRLEMFDPRMFPVRSQDLEVAYHDAGQFYWGSADAWIEERPLFSSMSLPIVLPRYRVVDIDTPEDWARAEVAFRMIRELEGNEQ